MIVATSNLRLDKNTEAASPDDFSRALPSTLTAEERANVLSIFDDVRNGRFEGEFGFRAGAAAYALRGEVYSDAAKINETLGMIDKEITTLDANSYTVVADRFRDLRARFEAEATLDGIL